MQRLKNSSSRAVLYQQLGKSQRSHEDCTAEGERNNRTVSTGFTSQAVASSTNGHRICAIGHAYAGGAHQNEIHVCKISDGKHIDGNKGSDSPFSHVQLLPTLLAHGGVALLLAVK